MRVDKYLWCVRLFKTRSQATSAIEKGRVKVNEQVVKPAKELMIGDLISVKNPPIWKTYNVLAIPKSRVGAKLVAELIEEKTTEEQLNILKEVQLSNNANRSYHQKGRPTKKDRRDLDDFLSD